MARVRWPKIGRKHKSKFGNKVHSQGDRRGLTGAVPDLDSQLYATYSSHHEELNKRLELDRRLYFEKHGTYLMESEGLYTESELMEQARLEAKQAKMLKDMGEPEDSYDVDEDD